MTTAGEREAITRRYWAKIRQALKAGMVGEAQRLFAEISQAEDDKLYIDMAGRVAETFTAGCEALGDPAQAQSKENKTWLLS